MVSVEDASGYQGHADRAFAPRDEDEVVTLLREASAMRMPVTIAGAGTGVTGGRVSHGGWLLSLEKFTRLDVGGGCAIAGAGVLLRDLHAAAAGAGQFYPPDPTETAAAIGGTIATNASGSRSFRYGATRRYVLGLRVVLMDGRVIEARRGGSVDFDVPALPLPRTTKHTAGYVLRPGMDWIDLFTGSEGTLGVVTEARLRLLPAPKALLAGVVFFANDDDAVAAAGWTFRRDGNRMTEYFDRGSLHLLRTRFPEIPRHANAALLFEQEIESEEALDDEAGTWHNLLASTGALIEASWFAVSAADRERFRRFRHALPELVNDTVRRRGFLKVGSDYAVPLERNGDMLAEYRRCFDAEFPGRYVIFGHIGDAHLHANVLPASREEFERAQNVMRDLARHAVSLGGTVSAEHGLGKRKAHLLALQYTPDQIEAMKQVKRRLDPHWLLGRGTLFP